MSKIAEVQTDENSVTFVFGEEENAQVTIRMADLPEDIIRKAAIHGLTQRLRDSYAGYGNKFETLEEAKQAAQESVEEILESLKSGTWTTRSAGGGGGSSSLWAEAFALAGVDAGRFESKEDGVSYYKDLENSKKAKARQIPEVIQKKQELEVEKSGDTSASFDDL